MTEKPTKRSVKRTRSSATKAKRGRPTHEQISERAYFIHLHERRQDELENWLRAERELAAA